MRYPAWLDRFNFPPDIDKADLSNMARALLWVDGQILDAIGLVEHLSDCIQLTDGRYLTMTNGNYMKWAV